MPNQLENELKDYINQIGESVNLDPDEVRAIIDQESSWNPEAGSSAGAKGLMQLMPETAKELGLKVDPAKGIDERLDPRKNIKAGATYYKKMLDRYGGDQRLARMAYNAGPGNVDKHNGNVPFKETQDYVNKVANYYKGRKGIEITDSSISILPTSEDIKKNSSSIKLRGGVSMSDTANPSGKENLSLNPLDWIFQPAKAEVESWEMLGDEKEKKPKPKTRVTNKESWESLGTPGGNSTGGLGGSYQTNDLKKLSSEDLVNTATNIPKAISLLPGIVSEGLKTTGDQIDREIVGDLAALVHSGRDLANIPGNIVNPITNTGANIINKIAGKEILHPQEAKDAGDTLLFGRPLKELEAEAPSGGAPGRIAGEVAKYAVASALLGPLSTWGRIKGLGAGFGVQDISNQISDIEDRQKAPAGVTDVIGKLNYPELATTAALNAGFEGIAPTGKAVYDATTKVLTKPKAIVGITKATWKSFINKLTELPGSEQLRLQGKIILNQLEQKGQQEGTVQAYQDSIVKTVEKTENKIRDALKTENLFPIPKKIIKTEKGKKGVSQTLFKEDRNLIDDSVKKFKDYASRGKFKDADDALLKVESNLKQVGVHPEKIEEIKTTLKDSKELLYDAHRMYFTNELFLAGEDATTLSFHMHPDYVNRLKTGKELKAPEKPPLTKAQKAEKRAKAKIEKEKRKKIVKNNTVIEKTKKHSVAYGKLAKEETNPFIKEQYLMSKQILDNFAHDFSRAGKKEYEQIVSAEKYLDSIGERIKTFEGVKNASQIRKSVTTAQMPEEAVNDFEMIKSIGETAARTEKALNAGKNPGLFSEAFDELKSIVKETITGLKEGELTPKQTLIAMYSKNYAHPEDALNWYASYGVQGAEQFQKVITGARMYIADNNWTYLSPFIEAYEKHGVVPGSTLDKLLFRIANKVDDVEFLDPEKLKFWTEHPATFIDRFKEVVPGLEKMKGKLKAEDLELIREGKLATRNVAYRSNKLPIKDFEEAYAYNQYNKPIESQAERVAQNVLDGEVVEKLNIRYPGRNGNTFSIDTPKYYLEQRVGSDLNLKESFVETTKARIAQSIENQATDRILYWITDSLEHGTVSPELESVIFSVAHGLAGNRVDLAGLEIIDEIAANTASNILNNWAFTALDLTQLVPAVASHFADPIAKAGLLTYLDDGALAFNNGLLVLKKAGVYDIPGAEAFSEITIKGSKGGISEALPQAVNSLEAKLGEWGSKTVENINKAIPGSHAVINKILSHPFISTPEDLLRTYVGLGAIARLHGKETPAVINALLKEGPSALRRETIKAIKDDIAKYTFTQSGHTALQSSKPVLGQAFRFSTTAVRSLALTLNMAKEDPKGFQALMNWLYVTGGSQAVLYGSNLLNWAARGLTGKDAFSGADYEEADTKGFAGNIPGIGGVVSQGRKVFDWGTGPRQTPDIAGYFILPGITLDGAKQIQNNKWSPLQIGKYLANAKLNKSWLLGFSPNTVAGVVQTGVGDFTNKSLAKKQPLRLIKTFPIRSTKGTIRDFPIEDWFDRIEVANRLGRKKLVMTRFADQLDQIQAIARNKYDLEAKRILDLVEKKDISSYGDKIANVDKDILGEKNQLIDVFKSTLNGKDEKDNIRRIENAVLKEHESAKTAVFNDYKERYKDRYIAIKLDIIKAGRSKTKRQLSEQELKKLDNEIKAFKKEALKVGIKIGALGGKLPDDKIFNKPVF